MAQLVSIVTPSFNDAPYIEELAETVLTQTCKDWEWIIVDDGSDKVNREKIKVISQRDERILFADRPADAKKGANACRNHGLQQAQGEFIIFMDSDDVFAADALTQRLEAVKQKNPDTQEVLYFETIGFEEDGARQVHWDDANAPMNWLESIWYQCPPCQSAGPLWPSALIESIGGWDENIAVWQDLEMHSRAYLKGIRFRKAGEGIPNVYYRIRTSSLSHSRFHSPEKTNSRLRMVTGICQSTKLISLTEAERLALSTMVFSVAKGLMRLRRFGALQNLIADASHCLSQDQRKALKRLSLTHKLRLNRIPLLNLGSFGATETCFPKPERAILQKPYLEQWPSITVVMLTFNGMGWIRDYYQSFLEQDYAGEWEWLVIDSGSTDGTVEFLQQFDRVRIHQIPNAEFGHGKTRNLACELSANELLLYTVQDACPRSKSWMTNMVADLEHHALDAVCGGQAVQPHPDNNPVQWYKPVSEPKVVNIVTAEAFKAMDVQQQIKACGWDDVNALYRRSSMERWPFHDEAYGEDMEWAKRCLTHGGRIGYAHAHKVWHHHHHYPGFAKERLIYETYWQYRIFGQEKKTHLEFSFIKWVKQLLRLLAFSDGLPASKRIKWAKQHFHKGLETRNAKIEIRNAVKKGNQALEELYLSVSTPLAKKAG